MLRIIALLVLLAAIALAIVQSNRDDYGSPAPPSTSDGVVFVVPAHSAVSV